MTEDEAHEAAQYILTAFWLYGNYRVDSRGPAGLLLKVLDMLDPVAAQRLRDGTDVSELVDHESDDV